MKQTTAREGKVMSEREIKLNDAIAALEWFRSHPDIPLPEISKLSIYSWDSKEQAAKMAAAMGTCRKSYDDYFFRLTKSFGLVEVEGVFSRNSVCERVVVGMKEVTTEEPDPEQVAQLPKRTITKQVEVVEWHCPEALGESA